MLLKKINRLLMYCSNRKKFCCCKKTMKNIKIVLRVLTPSQSPANLTSLTNLNSQVCQKENHFSTEKKIIRKVPMGVYGQVYALTARQRKNQIVKKQWSGKLELNFNSEKERFENIFKRDK